MDIQSKIKEATEIAEDKGFKITQATVPRALMLVITELAEAVEAHRKAESKGLITYDALMEENPSRDQRECFEYYVKHTLEDEIADTFIRLFHFCGVFDLKPKIEEDLIDPELKAEEDFASYVFKLTSFINTLYYFIHYQPNKEATENVMSLLMSALWNISVKWEFDLERHIDLKMEYNKGREHLHGKAY